MGERGNADIDQGRDVWGRNSNIAGDEASDAAVKKYIVGVQMSGGIVDFKNGRTFWKTVKQKDFDASGKDACPKDGNGAREDEGEGRNEAARKVRVWGDVVVRPKWGNILGAESAIIRMRATVFCPVSEMLGVGR
jgi:hypothetical protein